MQTTSSDQIRVPKGFVTVRNVAKYFNTSRSTIDRRRSKAQQTNDESVLKQFILKTRDGEQHEAPTRERVRELIDHGMGPEWFVSRDWLRDEYGERKTGERNDSGETASTGSAANATDESAVVALLKAQNDDLKQQLQQANAEKMKLLEYAQSDKQLFGSAVASLSKVFALPGIADAITTANRQISADSEHSDGEQDDDSEPANAPETRSPVTTDSTQDTPPRKRRWNPFRKS